MTDIITTLQLGIPGGPELLIVLVVIVLLFGANRIPKLARSTGQAMGEFQRGRDEIEDELRNAADGDRDEADELERDLETENETRTETETETEAEREVDEETERNA